MPQYDMPLSRNASGAPPTASPDPRLVEQLLNALAQIPLRDLPGGASEPGGFPRYALQRGIELGLIDNLYTPLGSDQWIIAWAEVEPWEDPRVPLAVWREVCAAELAKAQASQRGVAPDE